MLWADAMGTTGREQLQQILDNGIGQEATLRQ
jgi:hypothetical protein